jgi:hemerythrin
VEFLVAYAKEHFAAEERLMIETGDPGYPEHVARHREFAADLKRWQDRFGVQGPSATLVVELSAWLTGWLGDHIRKVDGVMARHLRARAP